MISSVLLSKAMDLLGLFFVRFLAVMVLIAETWKTWVKVDVSRRMFYSVVGFVGFYFILNWITFWLYHKVMSILYIPIWFVQWVTGASRWQLELFFMEMFGWPRAAVIPEPTFMQTTWWAIQDAWAWLGDNWHHCLFNVLVIAAIAALMGLVVYVLACLWARVFHKVADVIGINEFAEEVGFAPEKMMAGSVLENAVSIPKFQCEIYGKVDANGPFYKVGQGFRVGVRLLTAYHVVDGYETLRIKTERGTHEFANTFKYLEGDVAAIVLSEEVFSKLAMTSCKLNKEALTKRQGVFAKATAFGKQSMGLIEVYEAFGFVSYKGSTVAGFSGAPYYANNTVFGMHIGGHDTNMGHEAAYISMVLKDLNESSENWLMDQAAKEIEFYYERSPYDPDEYRVKVAGQYHVVDSEIFAKLKNQARPKNRPLNTLAMEFEKGEETESEDDDSDISSVNSMPLAPRAAGQFAETENFYRAPAVNAGARGVLAEAGVNVPAPRTVPPQGMELESRRFSERSRMVGQTSTVAPRNVVLGGTSRKQKRRNRAEKIRQMKSELQVLRQRSNPIDPGASTSRQQPM